MMGRQRVGDDIWSSCIVELYRLVVNEVLDTISQLETFFYNMPLGPKMMSALLGWIKSRWKRTYSGPLKQ